MVTMVQSWTCASAESLSGPAESDPSEWQLRSSAVQEWEDMAATKSELHFPKSVPGDPVGRYGRNEIRVALSQVCTQRSLGIGNCHLETRLLVLTFGSGAAREITRL
jgi:hypothetical protein